MAVNGRTADFHGRSARSRRECRNRCFCLCSTRRVLSTDTTRPDYAGHYYDTGLVLPDDPQYQYYLSGITGNTDNRSIFGHVDRVLAFVYGHYCHTLRHDLPNRFGRIMVAMGARSVAGGSGAGADVVIVISTAAASGDCRQSYCRSMGQHDYRATGTVWYWHVFYSRRPGYDYSVAGRRHTGFTLELPETGQ